MKNKIQKRQRFSNRTYPPKLCKKQDCNTEFVPTDGRQVYCNAQHRIDSNNDKRKVIDKIESDFNKKAKKNKQIMIKIKGSVNYIKSGVTNKSLLLYEGFEFPIYHRKQIDSDTNREIQICYDYGLILIDAKNDNYIIEKIPNK
jgi:hypothetical protein